MTESDFTIAGLTLVMSGAEVKATLGEPTSVDDVMFESQDWHYSGLTVTVTAANAQVGLNPDKDPVIVTSIDTTRPGDCLGKTICIGDPIDPVRLIAVGSELSPRALDKPPRLHFLAPHLEACWAWVGTDDNQSITQLRLACQP